MEGPLSLIRLLSLRFAVLFVLWAVPILLYVAISCIAIYQSGWLSILAWTLPPIWLTAWLVSKFWVVPKSRKHVSNEPIKVPAFWTAQDAAAMKVVEEFRDGVVDLDRMSIADPDRYFRDAQALSQLLAGHYHQVTSPNALSPLTIVELISVVHLSVEDLEAWVLQNLPGSDLVTVGQMEQLPAAFKALDIGQTILFLVSTIANPSKLFSYPIWRKSGNVTVALQEGLINAFYQVYLRQVGYYLIEMYSGRLKGGSRRYRQQFGQMAAAMHTSGGDASLFAALEDVSTAVVVMGQVKAGKSSLINALIMDKVAAISTLPETREVKRYDYRIEPSDNVLSLLDTPGYGEANVTDRQMSEIKSASQIADIILLVMAANSPARDADLQMVRELTAHYRQRPHLRPPPIIAVLTHIDLLRPVREWSPPYNWRNPKSAKEQSIANAVAYTKELFGEAVVGCACVYTGETHSPDSSVLDEVVPQLVEHMSHGHSAAILRAFYQQLSRQRFQQLATQVIGLLKHIGQSLVK